MRFFATVSIFIMASMSAQAQTKMTQTQASAFAQLALKGIQKEYPNKPGTVLNGKDDIKGPRDFHPAFYGSYDWHSSVHGHWMLVRLLRRFPELPERKQIRAVLNEHLTAKNLQAEADYFKQPNRANRSELHLRLGVAVEVGGGVAHLGRSRCEGVVEEFAAACGFARRALSRFSAEADLSDPRRRASEHGVRADVRARLRSHGRA